MVLVLHVGSSGGAGFGLVRSWAKPWYLAMPQVQLPIFPQGTTLITPELAFERREDQVVYFNGHLPVFTHQTTDLAAFRLFSSQLIINGTASQGQIVKAFGVPLTTVKRYLKKYRQEGPKGFFAPAPKRQGHKLTPAVLAEVQALLDEGESVPAVAAKTGVLATTLHKAIKARRLRHQEKRSAEPIPAEPSQPTTKSQRSVADGEAPLGVGTTRSLERVAAAVGILHEAPVVFEAVDDVPVGGVMCALPALMVLGLLRHTRELFSLPKGFYPIEAIFMVVAFLALARVRSLEQMRYEAPGEWGKLIGLDRIPEVKTMRRKLESLSGDQQQVFKWISAKATHRMHLWCKQSKA